MCGCFWVCVRPRPGPAPPPGSRLGPAGPDPAPAPRPPIGAFCGIVSSAAATARGSGRHRFFCGRLVLTARPLLRARLPPPAPARRSGLLALVQEVQDAISGLVCYVFCQLRGGLGFAFKHVHGEAPWTIELLEACAWAVAARHDDALRGSWGPARRPGVSILRDEERPVHVHGEAPWRFALPSSAAAPTAPACCLRVRRSNFLCKLHVARAVCRRPSPRFSFNQVMSGVGVWLPASVAVFGP